MPAVTLQNSTTQSSQNCGVRTALLALTLAVVTIALALTFEASKPSGTQPSAGTLISQAPKSITTR